MIYDAYDKKGTYDVPSRRTYLHRYNVIIVHVHYTTDWTPYHPHECNVGIQTLH